MMLNCLLSITGNEEPQKQAYEFGFAAESAYSMAQTQMKITGDATNRTSARRLTGCFEAIAEREQK